ncbi:hypothetical protein ET009_03890 [Lactococcus garvieae]|nr:hypothetical protein [Lactococcus garvieae]
MEKKLKKVIIMSISGLTLLSASMPSAVGMVHASNVNVVQEPDSKALEFTLHEYHFLEQYLSHKAYEK